MSLRLALIAVVLLASTLHSAEPKKKAWPPRILLNSDCGTPVFYRFDAPMNAKQLNNVINDLPGTQIDAFMPCPQFSDDQMWYPTKVCEPYDGRHVPDGKYEDKYFRRVANNVKSLIDRKLDPMVVWAKRSRELGMWYIPTMRMNDLHKDYIDLWPSLRSFWERKRKHLLIGKDLPPYYRHKKYKYSWAMDYAKDEVHERKLSIIGEICTRYDVDGFELDFMRAPIYFKKGQEATGSKRMNDFIRKVRQLMDKIGKKKGKRLRLLVRVSPQLSECKVLGLDVATWIRSGWVDLCTAMASGYLDHSADIASFVKLAKGTKCKIAGGLEYYVRGYRKPKQQGITWATLPMLRAGASAFYQQGADCIYLFNYDCHGRFPFRGDKRQALKEIGDRKMLVNTDKRYIVTVDMSRKTRDLGGDKQLPALLGKASLERIKMVVGDDLDAALKGNRLQSTTLRIEATKDNLSLVVNGKPTKLTKEGRFLVAKNPPVKQGNNQLRLTLAKRNEDVVRINGIELLIDYK